MYFIYLMFGFNRPKYVAKNLIVSLDFDGVIAHGLNVKLKYAKEWFGVDLELHQTKKDGFDKLMQKIGKLDINYRSLMDPLNEDHIMEYEIPPHCKETLHNLHKEGFRFVVITSRNDHDFPYAKKFIRHKFEHIIKYLHNTRNKSKDHFVHKLKPRIHIDDDLKKLESIKHLPVHLIYYRQPENKHQNRSLFDNSRIFEINNWKQFYDIVIHIKKVHEAICWKYDTKNKFSHVGKIYGIYQDIGKDKLNDLLKEYENFEKK